MYYVDSIVQVGGYIMDRLPQQQLHDDDTTPSTTHNTFITTESGSQPRDPSPQRILTHPESGYFFVQDMSLIQCAPNIRAISIVLRQYKKQRPERTVVESTPYTRLSQQRPPISVLIPFPCHPTKGENADSTMNPADKRGTTLPLNTSPSLTISPANVSIGNPNENASNKYYEYMYHTIACNLQHHYNYGCTSMNHIDYTALTAQAATKNVPFHTIAKLQQFILRGLQHQLELLDDITNNATIQSGQSSTENGSVTTGPSITVVCRRNKRHRRQRIPRIAKTDLQLLDLMEKQLIRHNDTTLRPVLQTPTFIPIFGSADVKRDDKYNHKEEYHQAITSPTSTTAGTTCTDKNESLQSLYGIDYSKIVDILFFNPNIDGNDETNGTDKFDQYDDHQELDEMCECSDCDNDERSSNGHVPVQSDSTANATTNDFTLSSKEQKSSRGSLTRYEYYIQKKIPQIQYMIQRIVRLFSCSYKSTSESNDTIHLREQSSTTYTILDVGGGRGDLSILLAYTLAVLRSQPSTIHSYKIRVPDHFHITVVDRNQASLHIGEQYAKYIFHTLLDLDYRTFLTFQCCDFIENYISKTILPATPTPNKPLSAQPTFDLVMALHACGDLTDAALHFATHVCYQRSANRRPSFLLCPCCYNKSCSYNTVANGNEPSFIPPYFQFTYSPHTQRATCTDDNVSGTATDDIEYGCAAKRTKTVGSTSDKMYPSWIKSIQKLAELSQQFSVCRRAAIIINSLRVQYATISQMSNAISDGTPDNTIMDEASIHMVDGHKITNETMTVQLEEFSSSYSRRNIVIVGSHT